eukprot:TRINITY_DN9979_c1_g1_i1.p1 TRINITY_DN9979_c1_g1~~TRINITY_DN9979_c1_g1_i1.p1  ORF type:complete len:430 (-),score=54.49 TRINITY_DN9979_c1_g1_i1:245-1534(-)
MTKTISCRFVIVGSGGSCSLPNLRHVLQPEAGCKVCLEAWSNPESKNRRGNPCLLVSTALDDGSKEHLLVDCGKTFEEAVRRQFPALKVHGLNAVLLTHGHADAILGLDSLREVQLAREPANVWVLQEKTPVYATVTTLKEAWHHFHYMFPADFGESIVMSEPGASKPAFRRRSSFERVVGGLVPKHIEEFKAFCPLKGLQVMPLPVLHGGTYVCMGFSFGANGEFVYLSDLSKVPGDTMEYLEECALEVLVLDSLLKDRANYSHFGLPQALKLVRKLRPKRTLLIGMSCTFDHERDDEELKKLAATEGLEVCLSYDGLVLELEIEEAAKELDVDSSDFSDSSPENWQSALPKESTLSGLTPAARTSRRRIIPEATTEIEAAETEESCLSDKSPPPQRAAHDSNVSSDGSGPGPCLPWAWLRQAVRKIC